MHLYISVAVIYSNVRLLQNVLLQYFRRTDKQDSGSKSPQKKDVDKQSVVAVENDAFLASDDSIEMEQNIYDSDDGLDGQSGADGNEKVKVEDKKVLPDDTYGNIESEWLCQKEQIPIDAEVISLVRLIVLKTFLAIEARVHNPIPVAEFNDHVNHLRQESNKEFKLEFEVGL